MSIFGGVINVIKIIGVIRLRWKLWMMEVRTLFVSSLAKKGLRRKWLANNMVQKGVFSGGVGPLATCRHPLLSDTF